MSSRDKVRQWKLDGETTINSQSDERTTSMYDVSLVNRRFLPERWFLQATGTVQGNEELGLNAREVLGAGLGRVLAQNGHNEWAVYAGLAGTRENFQSQVIQCLGEEEVAMIAAPELVSLMETAYLLRSPANAERLLSALGRALKSEGEAQSIEALRREVNLES